MAKESKPQTKTRRGPGRPRGFDREVALRAAMLLFWKQGFDGTSYTDLTRATGMSKPTIYATFGDKVELFRKAMTLLRGAGDKRVSGCAGTAHGT